MSVQPPANTPFYRAVISRLRPGRNSIWIVVAVMIGIIAAVGEIWFRKGVAALQLLTYGVEDRSFSLHWDDISIWIKLGVPVVGGLVVGLMVRFLISDQRPKAVADVIEASAMRDGRISWRDTLAGAAVNITALGAGASVGREGPIVHMGAGLASLIGRGLKLSPSGVRLMLACGVSAAIAAAFNAPLAGVFFALEVVLGSYGLRSFAPVVVSSVTATMISRQVYGNQVAFLIPPQDWQIALTAMPGFAFLGLAAAGLAIAFMWLVFRSEDMMRARLPMPRWLHPALAGLVLGVVGLWLPQVLGVGYEATDAALSGAMDLKVLAILLVTKLLVTTLCLGAGYGAGFFSPTLFLGAMLGGCAGLLYQMGLPDTMVASPTAYVIAGMGAVAGAVLGAPISTTLIVFELTRDYGITIAVLLATVLASTVLDITWGRSAFQWQLMRRGVNLRGGRERQLLEHLTVADVMRQDHVRLFAEASVPSLRDALLTARFGEVFITDKDGALRGFVTIPDLTREAELRAEKGEGAVLQAADFIGRHTQTVLAKGNLAEAIELMESEGEAHLPVIEDGTSRLLIGVLHERDAMAAYHKALLDTGR